LDRLHQAMMRARRHERAMALLFMDVDRFKQINDTHGHAAGDELLRIFSQRLLSCVRESDTAARLSGDEFTAILEDLNSPGDAEVVARRFLQAVREPMRLAGQEIRVTSSMGIAFYRGDKELTPEALLEYADQALYETKRGGRDDFSFHGQASKTTPHGGNP
jgi:diguanylate cyclase (GGDEF)-like protein